MDDQELNPRQILFAEHLAEGQTATEAYLAAGYKAATREVAHRNSSRLRRNPGVARYIRELRRDANAIAREDAALTIARKLDYLARIVITGAGGLAENDELVQTHRTYKDGGTYTKMPCKLKALKLHSLLAGHFDPEPAENTDDYDIHVVMGGDDEGADSKTTSHEGKPKKTPRKPHQTTSKKAGTEDPKPPAEPGNHPSTQNQPSEKTNIANPESNIVIQWPPNRGGRRDILSGTGKPEGRAFCEDKPLPFGSSAPMPYPYPGHDFPELYGPKSWTVK